MKKILLILALLTFLATPVFADVLLTWDPSPVAEDVDLYQVEIDGQVVADVAPNVYSVVPIADGAHVARVRAHNDWGWGRFSAPLDFVSGVPTVPLNLRLEFTP